METILISSQNIHGNIVRLDEDLHGCYVFSGFYGTNSFYNVTSTNNKVNIIDNGSPFILTLTNGSYTAATLKTQLTTQLNFVGNGNTYTCDYSAETGKYTVTANTNNFYFTFGSNTTNSARKLLGFDETDGTAGLTQSSDNVVQLTIHPVMYLTITQDIRKHIRGQNHYQSSLMLWDTDSTFGTAFRMNIDANNSQIVEFNHTKFIRLSFYDENFNAIDFNGTDWSLILKKA